MLQGYASRGTQGFSLEKNLQFAWPTSPLTRWAESGPQRLQSPAPHLHGLPDLQTQRGGRTVQIASPTLKNYLDS